MHPDAPAGQGKSPFEATHFPHGADIGVCGTGPTLSSAFEQAALAMMAVITDPAKVEPRDAVEIRCTAPDAELLLMDRLDAIVFEMATRGMIFGAFRVDTDGRRLRGAALGEPVSRRESPGPLR